MQSVCACFQPLPETCIYIYSSWPVRAICTKSGVCMTITGYSHSCMLVLLYKTSLPVTRKMSQLSTFMG